MMPRLLLLLVVLLALASPASAAYRVEVIGESAAGDEVGVLLVESIRARVGRFAGMTLASNGDRFLIEVATLDPDASTSKGFRTTWGVTFVQVEGSTWRYLAHSVGLCGATRVEQAALGIVSDLGKLISALASSQGVQPPSPRRTPAAQSPAKFPAPGRADILHLMTGLANVRTALAAPHPDFAAICAQARQVAASVSSEISRAPEWQKAVSYAKEGAGACSQAGRMTTITQFALAIEQLQALIR